MPAANARLAQRSGGRIEHASCNAHARREFVAAESNEPVLAAQAESFYRQLYDVEERGKTVGGGETRVASTRRRADLVAIRAVAGQCPGATGHAQECVRAGGGLRRLASPNPLARANPVRNSTRNASDSCRRQPAAEFQTGELHRH